MPLINTNENIRLWFLQCPEVSALVSFGADYMGEKATECAIYTMPSPLKIYSDIVGDVSYAGKQSLNFIFALRAPYGDDPEQNLENLQFFDILKEWIYAQNKLKNLPTISEGEVESILPVKTQYAVGASADSAVYEMQCTLTYWRDDE